VAYASQICDALEYLHANGIAHRDLKPQNIMVCSDGSLRLFDFGIARVEKARRLTFVGLTPALGTPDYISPEQVRGKRGDHRSDIYSLGAILYEMVTGSTPFEGESPYVVMNARVTGDPEAPRKLNPELNPALEEVILHALERDPRKRYQAADMKRELDNLDKVEITHRDQRLRAPQPWKSRRQHGPAGRRDSPPPGRAFLRVRRRSRGGTRTGAGAGARHRIRPSSCRCSCRGSPSRRRRP
jgi:serine/threonine protein kinase